MLTLHIASKTEYFVGLRRVKPMYFLIALEPCHLLFAVDMSVVTDALLRLLEGILSFKIHKHLLHANRVERVQMTHREDTPRLCLQPVVEHLLHSLVDTPVQFLTLPLQAYLNDAERTFLACASVKRTERTTCREAHLHTVNHSLCIALIHTGIIVGIEQAKLR